ncbi:protein HEXIM1 [Nelusetta ayraudi]|uniref:protein HEXIM1 n=1 Tax=Nelusetta ayraudi TaxID=303726 RepID=UPI003F71FCE5
MTEPAEQSHHQKTSDSPSGGISTSAMEHLPASDGGGPQNGDRGRQREHKKQQQQQQRRAENCGDINTDKLWQLKGGQRGVCPASAAGNELSKCPGAELPQHKPNSGKNGRPLEDTINRQDESSLVDSDTGLDARLGKKKHRRRASRKRRNWKPYYKLSWEERRALEEKETARASRVREEMFAKGLPVAPYNTTQFLMDEHDREEPDLNTETGVKRPSGVGSGRVEEPGSEEDCGGGGGGDNNNNDDEEEEDGSGGGGSDGIGRAGSAGGEFLQRDFCETYEMYHVESLQNMTKQELVQEYLELEKCMSRLEEENNRLRRAVEPDGESVESPLVRLGELEKELERLRAQNTELLLLKQDREQVATN